jgi:hypothetical protein
MKYLKKLTKGARADAVNGKGVEETKKIAVPMGATEKLKAARKAMNLDK